MWDMECIGITLLNFFEKENKYEYWREIFTSIIFFCSHIIIKQHFFLEAEALWMQLLVLYNNT